MNLAIETKKMLRAWDRYEKYPEDWGMKDGKVWLPYEERGRALGLLMLRRKRVESMIAQELAPRCPLCTPRPIVNPSTCSCNNAGKEVNNAGANSKTD